MPDRPDRTVTSYRDFDLLVGRAGKGYVVRVIDSPAGEASAKIPPRLKSELDELVERLAALPASPGSSREALRLAKRLGRSLHDALFHDEVGQRLAASLEQIDRSEGLRIKLRLASVPELSRWPWEYLYSPSRNCFLALSAATPVVRYPDLARGARDIAGRPPLSVLLVIAAPMDQAPLRSAQELKDIEEALASLVASGRLVLDRLTSATFSSLAERLRLSDVHVLHFIGHGAFDAEHGEGTLVFEDARQRSDVVEDDRLAALLLDHPALRLVFLNACEGAYHGDLEGFGGVAQRLLQQGVPAVVAMQRTISNRAAITFSRRFYEALASGTAIDTAVAKGRRAMDQAGHGIEWGAPTLYLRAADGVLLANEEVAEAVPGETPPIQATPSPADVRGESDRRPTLAATAAGLLLAAGIAFYVHGDRATVLPARDDRPPAASLAAARTPEGTKGRGPAVPPLTARPPDRVPAPPDRPASAPPTLPKSPACPSPSFPEGIEIDFVLVPSGHFLMGSTHGKPEEKPVHDVTISQSFCVAAYEVTVEQWEQVMGDGRIPATRNDQLRPKTSITWEEAEQFVERLNAQNPGRRFFLLSEAQWEYAARAGSAARFSFGDDLAELHRYANCRSDEGHEGGFNGPAPAGKFLPNQWNLSDMQGNVAEWVADFAGDYGSGPVVDPTGPTTGDRHIYRGGSWMSAPQSCSVAHRASLSLGTRRKDIGFRIAAEPLF